METQEERKMYPNFRAIFLHSTVNPFWLHYYSISFPCSEAEVNIGKVLSHLIEVLVWSCLSQSISSLSLLSFEYFLQLSFVESSSWRPGNVTPNVLCGSRYEKGHRTPGTFLDCWLYWGSDRIKWGIAQPLCVSLIWQWVEQSVRKTGSCMFFSY